MPRRRRWRVIVPLALLAVALVAVAYFLATPSKAVSSATVTRGTIISSVETTGKLEAQDSARLSFKASGRVETVSAKVGDRVKKGQVLAELDTDNLERQLQEARTQLEISRLNVLKAKSGARPEDITAATADLNAANADMAALKAGATQDDINAAQAFLNQAQAKLDALKRGPSANDIAAAQAQLDQAKANRDYVAATAANATEQARILYVQAGSTTKNFLDPAGQLEQARLNYEAAQKSEKAQLAAADAKVTGTQSALDAVKAGPTQDDLRVAQEAVNQAAANLDKVKSGPTKEQLTKAQARVDAAQANLTKLQTGATETDLAILQKQVDLARLSVDRATAALNDARLTSPLDGTLLAIDLDPGEIVNGSQPVATVADTASLRIKADVDEIDVGRVRVGQPVTVTLDAYPGIKLPGQIELLAPGATLKQGSTVYQATVAFTSTGEVVPREGMAANVDITAQRKDNVLTVPNRAIETVGRRHYVTIAQGDSATKVEVETGLSNNTDTEIISGLSEGQTVVLK
jgi:HlyD family secretion protein